MHFTAEPLDPEAKWLTAGYVRENSTIVVVIFMYNPKLPPSMYAHAVASFFEFHKERHCSSNQQWTRDGGISR